jgi:thiol:disulfide interchange protein
MKKIIMKKFWILSLSAFILNTQTHAENDLALKNFGKIFKKNQISSADLATRFQDFSKDYENVNFNAMTDEEIRAIKKKYGQELIARNKAIDQLRQELALVQAALQQEKAEPSDAQRALEEAKRMIDLSAVPASSQQEKAEPSDAERALEEAKHAIAVIRAVPESEEISLQPRDTLQNSDNKSTKQKNCLEANDRESLSGAKPSILKGFRDQLTAAIKRLALKAKDSAQTALINAGTRAKNYAAETARNQKQRFERGIKSFWDAYRNPIN